MENDNDKHGFTVRVFNIVNRLKMKLGRQAKDDTPGYLDPDLVQEADDLIEVLCKECPATIGGYLADITALWTEMRDMPESPEREELGKEIFTLAHEIKDIGSMCGYDLAAYFAESLRDYIAKTELQLEAQRVIIQAHMDAINAVHKQGLKDEGGPLADELKAVVKIAIDKYS